MADGQTILWIHGPATADGQPFLRIDDALMGDTGAQSLVFEGSLSASMAQSMTADVVTVDSTPTVAGHDDELLNVRITFPPTPSDWGDLEADGCQGPPLSRGGPARTFIEFPGFRALLANGKYHGAPSCDYDRDGDLDLVLLGYDTHGLSSPEKFGAMDTTPTPGLLHWNQELCTIARDTTFRSVNIGQELPAWSDVEGNGDLDIVMGATGKELQIDQLRRHPAASAHICECRMTGATRQFTGRPSGCENWAASRHSLVLGRGRRIGFPEAEPRTRCSSACRARRFARSKSSTRLRPEVGE